jgi:hypothetical protein
MYIYPLPLAFRSLGWTWLAFSLEPIWFLHINYLIICCAKTFLGSLCRTLGCLPCKYYMQYLEDSFFCQYIDMHARRLIYCFTVQSHTTNLSREFDLAAFFVYCD